MLPACVWENEQTCSLNCNMQITKPFLHKFGVRKQTLCKSTEVPLSWKFCPGFPKGRRGNERTNAELSKLPFILLWFCIFFITLCLKWASHWALSFTVLALHLIRTNFSYPAPWSLNGYNLVLYFPLVSCAVNSWMQILYLDFQSFH